jgi:hypothetical protein
MQVVTTVGLDLAKSVFQVYGDASRISLRLQKGARFIGVFASLSEQDGTPAQRAAKTSEFETPAEI